ncbi:MAG: carboxypeptidase-like regulatory domain-containing protein [Crocinitomicaceae bacterium]
MKHIVTFALFFLTFAAYTQDLQQTVRGTITDFDTKVPIYGAKVILVNSDPVKGSVSDDQGDFKLENVTIGRIQLRITAMGYQDIFLPNILVESGKETVLNLEMLSDIQKVEEVEIVARKDKSQALNKMATVSAKTFSVEETNRYAGSLNDPARMVSGFAGVTGNPEGDNDIVVRGNSPRGILWRLDGIDIPNPNHFANNGATGGPISALNGAMLANSDFFSGAFAPEYGNALSGVFDVNLRKGNNETREYSFSAGIIGIDGTLEGPFKEGYRGSYIANYRYSSIALLDRAGILDFDGIPVYQDGSFKFFLPTKNAGTFTVLGMGGMSTIDQTDQDDETGFVHSKYSFSANMGMVGLKHAYIASPKLYFKSYISASTAGNSGEGQWLRADSSELFISERDNFRDHQWKAQTIANYKINQKNLVQAGVTYTHFIYQYFYEDDYDDEDGIMTRWQDSEGSADMVQSFVSWKNRLSNDFTIISGVHYTQFLLNQTNAVEPRLGIKWAANHRNTFSFGAGMHSRLESVSTYLYNELQADGSYYYPNRDLDLSRSVHTVFGYGFNVNENLYLKTELYYQHLYGMPVHNDSTSYLSLVNSSSGIPSIDLVNEGTGRNYGIELTVERFFNDGYYFLLTGSVYKSEFEALDGITRSTRFDAGFASNFLFGKEWVLGKSKNKTIGVNSKVTLIGGNRYTPVNLEASQDAGHTVYHTDQGFSAKGDPIFFTNIGVTYRVDKKRVTHAFKIDVRNVTNNQARIREWYSDRTESIEYDTQLSMIPNLIYTLKF